MGRFKSSVYLITSISFGMVSDTSSTIVSICLFLLQFKPTCSLIIKVKYISTRNNCIWFCLVIIVSKMVKMHVFNLETYRIWMRACFRFVFFHTIRNFRTSEISCIICQDLFYNGPRCHQWQHHEQLISHTTNYPFLGGGDSTDSFGKVAATPSRNVSTSLFLL